MNSKGLTFKCWFWLILCAHVCLKPHVYLLANGVRCQLVVVHHEPHQICCIGERWVRNSCDGVILEVQVLHTGGNGWHDCQAPPITVHGNREAGRTVTLIWTWPSCGVCLQGAIVLSLAPAVQPGEGVSSMGEGKWNQGRQEEDRHRGHGHSHTNPPCNLSETMSEPSGEKIRNWIIHKSSVFSVH